MPSAKKSVKLVPLQTELVEQLYNMASSLGVPFKSLLNNLVEKGIRLALLNNGDLDAIEIEYYVQKAFSRLGFSMVPLPLLSKVIESISSESYDAVLNEATENGRNIGMLLSLDSNGSVARKIENLLKALFPDSHQVRVMEEEDVVKIAVIAHGRTRRLLELPMAVVRGAMESFGYRELENNFNEGLVLATYKKADKK